jgi:hypothetical protein
VSVLDDLRAAEQRVAERLRELEPSVAEYNELKEVADRIGISIDAAPTPTPAATATKRSTRRRRASRPARPGNAATATSAAAAKPAGRARAGSAQRSQQLVELVRARPGITVREAGTELGVDPTSLYRVVRRLEERGELRKNGRNLEVVAAASA